MLESTINSYVYQQYADDDDLQAFAAAYNQATQAYVTWFNTVGLPYYPGLSGSLLDWVAEGLYGLTRTTLASQASSALGPLNTAPLNTMVLNGYTPPTQVYYNLTDDVFQRILTWDFYKGDGKRFCIRWLKRRIMRFLLGVNGIDPQPWDAGFVVGCETTNAISVQIAGGVVTVTIYQVLLSQFAQITPGTLTLFQVAFQGGALDLPIQYTYVCTIVAPLTAIVSPQSQIIDGFSTSQTTGTSTVRVYAGSGSFTYAWTWATGGMGITINTPSVNATSFSVTGGVTGTTYSGLALCTVTDTVTGQQAFATVTVSIECLAIELLTETGAPILTESGLPIYLG